MFREGIFASSFRAEATSRGVQVKGDVPVRLSPKSQNLGAQPILVVGPADILPADNHRLKANASTKSCRLGRRPSPRRLSSEEMCYADKHMFLSLNQYVKNFDNLRIRARLHIFEAIQLLPDSAHVEPLPKSIPEGSLRGDKQCLAQQSDASSRELSTMKRVD